MSLHADESPAVGAVMIAFGSFCLPLACVMIGVVSVLGSPYWALVGILLGVISYVLIHFGWAEVQDATQYRREMMAYRARMARANVPS